MNLLISFFLIALGTYWTLTQPELRLQTPCEEKTIVKAAEPVILLGKSKAQVHARIDTGATYSSMDKELAKKLGFNQVIGEVEIRNAHGVTYRPLVKVSFLLKGKSHQDAFSLADRTQLQHPVLIGRSSLKGYLVDPQE